MGQRSRDDDGRWISLTQTYDNVHNELWEDPPVHGKDRTTILVWKISTTYYPLDNTFEEKNIYSSAGVRWTDREVADKCCCFAPHMCALPMYKIYDSSVFRANFSGEIHSFEDANYVTVPVNNWCIDDLLHSTSNTTEPTHIRLKSNMPRALTPQFDFANFETEIGQHPWRHPFCTKIQMYINFKQEIRVPTGNGRQSMRREAGRELAKGRFFFVLRDEGIKQLSNWVRIYWIRTPILYNIIYYTPILIPRPKFWVLAREKRQERQNMLYVSVDVLCVLVASQSGKSCLGLSLAAKLH